MRSTLSTKQCSIHPNSWLISKCHWLPFDYVCVTGISDEAVISMRQNADANRGTMIIDCGTGPNRVVRW